MFLDGENKKHRFPWLKFFSVYLFNRRVDLVTTDTLIEVICKSCKKKVKIIVSNYNVHAFNLSMLLPEFLAFQQNADITVCDGMGILKGLEIMGIDLSSKYRVPLTLTIPKLLNECERYNLSVFLLGSKPQNLEKALHNLKAKHPNLNFSGHHGYFDPTNPIQNQTAIEQINQFKPDILVVGMGMPLQEFWIQKNYQNLEALVIIPCGAVIDRLAGLVPNSPKWISDAGLEWLYRLIREPKRLAARYLLGNSLFLLNLVWAKYYELYSTDMTKSEITQDLNINKIIDLKANQISTKESFLT